MTTAGFAYFVQAISRDVTRRGFATEVDTRGGVINVQGRPAIFGLVNLAQMCHSAPLDEWDGIIREHFDDLPVDEPAFGVHPPFEQVSDHLRVRLYAAGGGGLEQSVVRPVAEGIVELLVVDEPSRVRSVSREDALAWRRNDTELFDIGRALVREQDPVEADVEMIDEFTAVTLLHGEGFFVASHALWPLDHCRRPATHGLIVAIPNRHVVFIHEVHDVSVVGAINAMGRSIPAMYRAGPGSISPLVYWWFQGAFTAIPMRVGDDRVLTVSPPPALVALLNTLPEVAGG